MKHLICILTDAQNKPVSIHVITGTATISPYTFDTEDAAHVYKRQLEDHYFLTPKPAPKRKRVKCNQTGEIFPTAAAAAKAYKVSRSAMTHHLKEPHIHRTIKGFTFANIDENGNTEYPQ